VIKIGFPESFNHPRRILEEGRPNYISIVSTLARFLG
jgi:hypothetical protein